MEQPLLEWTSTGNGTESNWVCNHYELGARIQFSFTCITVSIFSINFLGTTSLCHQHIFSANALCYDHLIY